MTPPPAEAPLGVSRQVQSTEQAPGAGEEPLAGAFEHAPIGMALLTADGQTLRVNRALCEMLGYSEAELVSGTVRGVTHPDDDAAGRARFQHLLNGEIDSYQIEKQYIPRDGHTLWTLTSLSLVRDGRGVPRYAIVHVQDISKHKEVETALREREERLRVLLEQMPAAVWTTDADLRFTSGRGAGLGAVHLEPDEVVGMSVAEYFHADGPNSVPLVAHRAALLRSGAAL